MTSFLSDDDAPWFEALRARPQAFHALRADPRVSFTLYVPEGFIQAPAEYSLIVSVHGSGRNAHEYRDAFAEFADAHRCVVLAPLFPVGVLGDGYADGYKNLIEGNCRYDLLLLEMVKDIEEAFDCRFGPFYLFGFSGGGQFAHRFFYLHPDRLAAVSIGAPGAVTRIDDTRRWWFGTQDVAERFGARFEPENLKTVRVQLVVGGNDTEAFVIPKRLQPLIDSLGNIGRNRVERLGVLQQNYRRAGIDAQLDVIPGVAHEGLKVVSAVQTFFRPLLA